MNGIRPIVTDQNEFENRVQSKLEPFSNGIILYRFDDIDCDFHDGTQTGSYAES